MANGDDALKALKPFIDKYTYDQNQLAQVSYEGDDIHSDVQEGTTLGDYAKGHNVAIWDNKSLQNKRASEQSILGAMGNGVAQTIFAAPSRILASIGDMLDAPDYVRGTALGDTLGVDGTDHYGNFFSEWVRENLGAKWAENQFEVRTFADQSLTNNLGSYEWWRQATGALTSLAGSATEFAGAGFGVGALISKGLKTAGMVSALGKGTLAREKAGNVAQTLLTAAATNQAESIGMAADLHQRIYTQALKDGLTIDQASEKAGIAAATSINMNRMNIAFNLSSVGIFGMGNFGTRQVLDNAKLGGWKNIGKEAGQEFAEEVVNFTAEKSGEYAAERGKKVGVFDFEQAAIDRAKAISEDPYGALEAGILGAIGGAGQTALTNGMASSNYLMNLENAGIPLPKSVKKVLSAPFGEEVVVFDDNGIAKEKPRNEDGSFAGFETEKITKAEAHKRRYETQQKLKTKYEETFGKENAAKMFDLYTSAATQKELMGQMVDAKEKGDTKTYNKLRETMLSEQAYQAFESGTTGILLDTMKGEMNRPISQKEMDERGLPADYKENMKRGISMVEELEKEYIKSKQYHNSHAIYTSKAASLRANEYKNKAKVELNNNSNALNTAIQEAISDGRIKLPKVTASEKAGKDTIIKEIDASTFIGGDYVKLLNGEIELTETQDKQIKPLLEEIGKLFVDEIEAVGLSNKEVKSATEEEYFFKDMYTASKSKEAQKAAQKKIDEDTAKINKDKLDKVQSNKNKGKENANSAKAEHFKNQAKSNDDANIARELSEKSEKPEIIQTTSRDEDAKLDDNIPTSDVVNTSTKEDERDEKPGTKGRSKNKIVRKSKQPIVTKPISKDDTTQTPNSQEVNTLKEVTNKLKTLLDTIPDNENQDPSLTEEDNTIIEVVKLQRQVLIALENEYNSKPSLHDLIHYYVKEWGEEYVSRKYPVLRGAFEMITNSIHNESFEDIFYLDNDQANQLQKTDEMIDVLTGIDSYTDETEDVILDHEDDVIEHDNYNVNELNENKTWTGHNILAYLTLSPDIEFGSTFEQQVENIKENMKDPKLLSTTHFPVGKQLIVKVHPNPNSQIITYNNVKMTFGEYTQLIKKKYKTTAKFEEAYNNELPMQVFDSDGNLVADLHAVSWINKTNVSSKVVEISDQKKELQKIRAKVISEGQYSAKINHRTAGTPIINRDSNGNIETQKASVAFKNPDLKIMIKGAEDESLKNSFPNGITLVNAKQVDEFKDGTPLILIPTGGMDSEGNVFYYASALRNQRLNQDTLYSIEQAILAFTDKTNNYDSFKRDLLDRSGIDLSTIQGLRAFIQQYVYTLSYNKIKNSKGATVEEKLRHFAENKLDQDKVVVFIDNDNMYIIRGFGMPLSDSDPNAPNMIKLNARSKNIGSILPLVKNMFSTKIYNKLEASKLNTNEKVFGFNENGVVDLTKDKGYNDYIKSNNVTIFGEFNVGSETEPVYVYSLQPIIEFEEDTNPINIEKQIEKGEITEQDIADENDKELGLIKESSEIVSDPDLYKSTTDKLSEEELFFQLIENRFGASKDKIFEVWRAMYYDFQKGKKITKKWFSSQFDNEKQGNQIFDRFVDSGIIIRDTDKFKTILDIRSRIQHFNTNAPLQDAKDKAAENKQEAVSNNITNMKKKADAESQAIEEYERTETPFDSSIFNDDIPEEFRTNTTSTSENTVTIKLDSEKYIGESDDVDAINLDPRQLEDSELRKITDPLSSVLMADLSASQQEELVSSIVNSYVNKVFNGAKNYKVSEALDAHITHLTSVKLALQSDLTKLEAQNPLSKIQFKGETRVIADVIQEFKKTIAIYDGAINNKNVLARLVTIKLSSINGIKTNQEELTTDDSSSDLDKDQMNENASFTTSSKKTAGANVRRFLSGISDMNIMPDGSIKEMKTWFGVVKALPFDTVFDTLSKLLAGVEPSFDSMIAELERNYESFPWLKNVVEKLKKAKENDGTGVENEFVLAMSKHEITMKFVFWERNNYKGNITYKVRVLNANQNALGKAINDQWFDNLKRSNDVTTEINGEYFIRPEVATQLVKEYEAILNYESNRVSELKYNDVAPLAKLNKVVNIGDEVILDKIPTDSAINSAKNFPVYVNRGETYLKIDKSANNGYVISRIDKTETPISTAKFSMLQTWLAKMGMDVSMNTLLQLEKEGIKVGAKKKNIIPLSKLLESGKGEYDENPFNHIYNKLKEFYKLNPDGTINIEKSISSASNLDSDNSILNHKSMIMLSQIQAKYEKQIFSTTFKSGKKDVSTYTANKYVSDRLRMLQTDNALITQLKKISFSSQSLWLQDFNNFDNTDNPLQLGYAPLQVLKQKGSKNKDDKSLLDITPGEHEYYKLALFTDMIGGMYNGKRLVNFMYPTAPAEKSSRFIIQYTAYDTGLSNGSVSEGTIKTFYDTIFLSEFYRIWNFQQNEIDSGVKEYNAGANLFHFFPKLNTIKELWNEDGTIKKITGDGDLKEMQDLVKNAIKQTIDDAVSAKIKSFKDFGLAEQNKSKRWTMKYVDEKYLKHISGKAKAAKMDEVTATAYDYEVNQMIANANIMQLFVGDPALFHKESAATNVGKKVLRKHLAVQEYLRIQREEAQQDFELGDLDSYGNWWKNTKQNKDNLFDNFDILLNKEQQAYLYDKADIVLDKLNKNQILLSLSKIDEDFAHQVSNNIMTEVYDNVGKRLAADVAPGYDIPNSKGKKIKYLFIKDTKSESINREYYNRLKVSGAKDYSEIEGADGQEYSTWQFHIQMLLDIGKISKVKYDELKHKLENNISLNSALLTEVLQPIKPVFTYNEADIAKDFDRRLFIKTSSFPLIPQLTQGLDIDNLRKIMEGSYKTTGQTDYDRAPMTSSVKVGAPTTAIQLFNKDMTINQDLTPDQIKAASLELPMEGFRIQMDVPYDESKQKVTVGSQERKLMFTNLRGETFEYNGEQLLGKDLEQKYNDLYDTLYKSSLNKLEKEIILEDEEGNKYLNKARLGKILKEEAFGRGYPIADTLGIEFDSAINDFVIPLWANPSHKQFESLLISIVQNRVLKMKFNGGSFVMGSEEGLRNLRTEKTTDEEYENEIKSYIRKYRHGISFTRDWQGQLYPGGEYYTNDNESRRYTQEQYEKLPKEKQLLLTKKILPAQVLIPSKFRNKQGHIVDMRNFVNPNTGLIDNARLPKEVLEFFQFRIPTQGLNSMSWSKIVGFLPPESGDLIICSRDLTKQKGVDYDVDKEYCYFYNTKTTEEETPDLIQAKAELDRIYSEDGLLATYNNIRKESALEMKEKEFMPLVYKSEWAKELIVKEIYDRIEDKEFAKSVAEYYDSISEEELVTLNNRGYIKEHGGLASVQDFYEGNTAIAMSVIKVAFEEVHSFRSEHNRPFYQYANAIKQLNSIRTERVVNAKNKLREASNKALSIKKAGQNDTTTVVYVEGINIDPDTEQLYKIKVVTNDDGEILNTDEIRDLGLEAELEARYGGDYAAELAYELRSEVSDKKIMNELLDIHSVIMNSPHSQKYIYEPLSFGDLKTSDGSGLAKTISEFQKARNVNSNTFSPLGSEFMRDALTTGLAGRTGIGTLSLDSVFLSQLQNKDVVLMELIPTGEKNEAGNDKYEPKAISLRFGNVFTQKDGDISGINVNQNPNKKRFDVIAAFQSASVDNIKEKILDKVNANKITFPVIRAMALLGFDEGLISALLSQDSIIKLTNDLFNKESELIYDTRSENDLIKEYVKEHNVKEEKQNHRGYADSIDDLGFQELMDMIEKGDTYGEDYHRLQAGLMRKFLWLKELGNGDMKSLQNILKVDSAGVGANFMEIALKYEDFLKVLRNNRIENSHKMIGDFVVNNNTAEQSINLRAEGYTLITGYEVDYWVKPKTIPGQALIYGLKTANEIFTEIIPYHELFTNAKALWKIYLGKELKTDDMNDMFDDFKSYLFTHDASKVIGSENFTDNFRPFKSIQDIRRKLLIDEKDANGKYTHMSLATILNDIKKKGILVNPLISRLGTTNNDTGINDIIYNSSAKQLFDETAIYNGFAELFKLTKNLDGNPIRQSLGVYNGKEYDTVQLGQDLISYLYITGGLQGASNFVKYIPVSYLTNIGFSEGLRDLMNDTVYSGKDISPIMDKFFYQWIRNNPEKATTVKEARTTNDEGLYCESKTKNIFSFKKGIKYRGEYISIKDRTSPVGYKLFKWNEKGEYYNETNTLGTTQMPEYDATNLSYAVSSVIKKYRGKKRFGSASVFKLSNTDSSLQRRYNSYPENDEERMNRHIDYLNSVREGLSELQDFEIPSANGLYAISDWMITQEDFLKDYDLIVDNQINARASHQQIGNGGTIKFNEYELQKGTDFARLKTITHEYVHAFTDKYLNMKDISSLSKEKQQAIVNLRKLHEEFKSFIGTEAYIKMMNDLASGSLSEAAKDFEYAAKSVNEFMALVMTSKPLQEHLKSLKSDNTNWYERFMKALSNLLKVFGFEGAEGTKLAEAVEAFMTLTDADMEINVDEYTLSPVKDSEEAINQMMNDKFGIDTAEVEEEQGINKGEIQTITDEEDVTNTERLVEKPVEKVSKGKLNLKPARKEEDDRNANLDPKHIVLKEGANRVLRINKMQDIADKLIKDGSLKFKCD